MHPGFNICWQAGLEDQAQLGVPRVVVKVDERHKACGQLGEVGIDGDGPGRVAGLLQPRPARARAAQQAGWPTALAGAQAVASSSATH